MALPDPFARAAKVADAVLYEGYVLYPYRASARKNQIRWQFGVVAPRAFAEADPSEDWVMQTECLVEASGMDAELDVRIRFLRVQERRVERAVNGGFEPVASLEVEGELLTSWDEAVEEECNVRAVSLSGLLTGERTVPLRLDAQDDIELLSDAAGAVAGRVVRRCQALAGVVRMAAEVVPGPYPLIRVRARIENETPWSSSGPASRDDVVRRSFAAVHTLMAARDCSFISLADPPEFARPAVALCSNLHTWPVLIGDPGERNVVLSSPVTLSDYPEIAPESPGDMFDATEIDEILALRVMTLTEEEKREARSTDPRAAAIIDRCDIMPEEIFERLHGAVRYLRDIPGESGLRGPNAETGLRGPNALTSLELPPSTEADPQPWWTPDAEAEVDPFGDKVWVGTVAVGRGTRVVLRPSRRADAHDIFLSGREATVQAVFQDVDGNTQVAVSVLDDEDAEYQLGHGRYLFFFPDEVEPLGVDA